MRCRRLLAPLAPALVCWGCTALEVPGGMTADSVFTLGATPATLVADGGARAVIRATFKAAARSDSSVAFSTTAGSFVGGTASIKAKIADNVASAILVADTAPGTVTVAATAGGFVQAVTVTLTAQPPGKVVLTPPKQTAPASGTDAIPFTVQLFPVTGGYVSRNVVVTLSAVDSTRTPVPALTRALTFHGADLSFQVTSVITGVMLFTAQAGGVTSDTVRVTYTKPG